MHLGAWKNNVDWRLVLSCLLLVGVCTSCAGPRVQLNQKAEKYEGEMAKLQKRLVENPDDAEALREIGIIYLRTSRYAQAYDQLKKAYARLPEDPKTRFYLGTASELIGKQKAALRLYGTYSQVSRTSPYRRRLEGRYQWLVRKMAREEMKKHLAQEDTLSRGNISPRIVAVFPISYQGKSEQYAPLGRGLAEMMTVDLANIQHLKVVERTRIQALLDELKLSQSQYVDPSTAPRLGRLLGAGRLVGGSYNVLSDDALRLDVALSELDNENSFPAMESRTGALDQLFQIEKEAVFRVLDRLGIELTSQERQNIEEVPTQNLQAFLAYSRGLAQEDAGMFGKASQSFKKASKLDPGFEAAAQRAETTESMDRTGGAVQNALSDVLSSDASNIGSESTSSIDLMGNRMRSLNNNTGSLYGPGPDARQPATETVDPDIPLPDPPGPPANK